MDCTLKQLADALEYLDTLKEQEQYKKHTEAIALLEENLKYNIRKKLNEE